jgi:hypothetical protein
MKESFKMTEEEFYQLKPGDLVEYNGVKYNFARTNISRLSFDGTAVFGNSHNNFNVYKNGNTWTNSYTLSDDKTLGNLKLIKKNSTIDEKISETKSEIEKLQNQLKELESEKNSKKIEQMISEMVPGKFYTIVTKNGNQTGKYVKLHHRNDIIYIEFDGNCSDKRLCIDNILKVSIKDIIPREDLTNDYNKFMEKIKKYNQGEL